MSTTRDTNNTKHTNNTHDTEHTYHIDNASNTHDMGKTVMRTVLYKDTQYVTGAAGTPNT